MQDQWATLHRSPDIAESGGEENNTASDFARHWAITHIVECLVNEASEYVILFEYLQDIAVLDSPESPSKITLYQLKKRSHPHWTRSSLTATKSLVIKETKEKAEQSEPKTKRGKRLKGESILGKLYFAVESASSVGNATGVLLTDCQFDMETADGQRITPFSRTPLDELCESDIQFINKRLEKEIGPLFLQSRCQRIRRQSQSHARHNTVEAGTVDSRYLDQPWRLDCRGPREPSLEFTSFAIHYPSMLAS
jgi:hypothetical protein